MRNKEIEKKEWDEYQENYKKKYNEKFRFNLRHLSWAFGEFFPNIPEELVGNRYAARYFVSFDIKYFKDVSVELKNDSEFIIGVLEDEVLNDIGHGIFRMGKIPKEMFQNTEFVSKMLRINYSWHGLLPEEVRNKEEIKDQMIISKKRYDELSPKFMEALKEDYSIKMDHLYL